MDLREKKQLISSFLRSCNHYADEKLAEYRQRAARATGMESLELQDKISHWTTYKAFNEHTLAELESDVLDHWLD
jgi:DNA-binding phage protein